MGDVFDQLALLREAGTESMLITVVESEGSVPGQPGAKMLVTAEGWATGTVGGGAVEKLAIERAQGLLGERRSLLVRYDLSVDGEPLDAERTGMICGGRLTLFFDHLGYGAPVYVFGAGHVGRAIARHLRGMPYHVTVIDHRPEMNEGTEGADRVLIGDYLAMLAQEPVPSGGYFLIATPSHVFDYDILRHVMGAAYQPRYVGMLGSKNKVETMTERLAQDLGRDRVDWSVLYSPVGLDVGGPTPDEIAIAIIAEMQAVRHAKAGHRHMRLAARSRSDESAQV